MVTEKLRVAPLAFSGICDVVFFMVNHHTTLSVREPAEFHAALHAWYAAHGRHDLPWRNTGDPYAIYLSEIMLQQTQVSTVLARYYFPFLQQFPSLAALASAPRESVLKAWQGLGYYNRAANLHAAAIACGGQLPPSVDALMALPGIGRNTAHAVAAFAFRLPVAVMEANVKRVLCRIFALENPAPEILWQHADTLLDVANPFDYNQAMMDIGAMICTKRAPKCAECPANSICEGKTAPELYPAPKQAKQTPVRKKHITVVQNAEGKFFAERREGPFLRGMYRFIEEEPSLRRRPGMTKLGNITQVYSHFTLEAEVFLARFAEPKPSGEGWFTWEELHALPHSKAEEKIIALLASLPRRPIGRRAH